eukprot:8702151-Lingulodinium_polyedra.AAC.1
MAQAAERLRHRCAQDLEAEQQRVQETPQLRATRPQSAGADAQSCAPTEVASPWHDPATRGD